MQNYPFNFETLFEFANSDPYNMVDSSYRELFEKINQFKKDLNFPAVNNDVGVLINFLVQLKRPKNIFEMGSGYGHSAFWYLQNDYEFIENIYLTEKRDDLKTHFEALPWPVNYKKLLTYHQGDAFELLETVKSIDFLLIDGVKADYLRFLEDSFERLSDGALIIIDNSYWRGSFLDPGLQNKKSSQNILQLHEYLKRSTQFQSIFLPFKDGISLLRKLPF